MGAGKYKLHKRVKQFEKDHATEAYRVPGRLGVKIGGKTLIEVPNRKGYVYVRLRGDLSELIQAYNSIVANIYDLPVICVRSDIDQGKWYIEGRDISAYSDWGNSSYLPDHGAQHSFDPNAPGRDITWVWNRQFMPLNAVPNSGSVGANNLLIEEGLYYQNNLAKFFPATLTVDLLSSRPTTNQAKIVLVYLDTSGSIQLASGAEFSASLTGTADAITHLPSFPSNLSIPIAGVLLASGTSIIDWDNTYDLRPFFRDNSGGGGSITVTGTTQGAVIFVGSAGSLISSPYFYIPDLTPGYVRMIIGANQVDADDYMSGYRINVVGESGLPGTDADYGMAIWRFRDTPTSPPMLDFFRARGDLDAPDPVSQGDWLLQINSWGYSDDDFNSPGLVITAQAAEDFLGNNGSLLDIAVTPTGSSSANSTIRIFSNYVKVAGNLHIPGTYGYILGGPTSMVGYAPDYLTSGTWRGVLLGGTYTFQVHNGTTWVTRLGVPTTAGSAISDAATQDLTGTDTINRSKVEADLTSCKNAINSLIDRLQELGVIP